jgi:hypothetical protein
MRAIIKVSTAVLLLASAQAVLFLPAARGQDPAAKDPELERLEKETKRYQQEKAMWDAREAAAKAQSASTSQQFGSLASFSNTPDSVKMGSETGVGKLETNLLATTATRQAAAALADRLCSVVADHSGVERAAACAPGTGTPPAEPKLPIRGYALTGEACQDITTPDRLPLEMTKGGPAPNQLDSAAAVVFLTEGQTGYFDGYEALMTRLTSLGRDMCSLIDSTRTHLSETEPLLTRMATRRAPAITKEALAGGGIGLPGAATALNTIANLVRTEYSVYYHSLTPDQAMLIKETALAFRARRPGTEVFAPELFPLTAPTWDNPLQNKLDLLDAIVARAMEQAEVHGKTYNVLAALAEGATGPQQNALNAASNTHEEDQKALLAAAKAYKDLMTVYAQGAEGKPPVLALGLRQARAAQLLKEGGLLVLLKLNFVGGTTYSKKNFFTAFGGMPFYASGGAIASYTVMDGRSGRIIDSAAVPASSGFQSVPAVHRGFRRQRDRGEQGN